MSAEDLILRSEGCHAVVPGELYMHQSGDAVRLYCVIRGLGSDRSTWRGKDALAEALGWGRTRLYKVANELEASRWLVRKRVESEAGWRSIWTAQTESARANLVRESEQGSSPARTGEFARANRVVRESEQEHPTSPHRHPTTPTSRKRSEESKEDFDKWWSLWPHKKGKGQARKGYAKALKITDAATLYAALEKQLAHLKDQKSRGFCPHPATWLNGERWEDEPDGPVVSDRFSELDPDDWTGR